MDSITSSLKEFFDSHEIRYSLSDEGLFFFKENNIRLLTVPVSGPFPPEAVQGTIYLYEDTWRRNQNLISQRLLAHLGQFKSIFARNCTVARIDTPEAAEFLDKYHSYGSCRSKYRYGLFHKGILVAVASFSAGRPMERPFGTVESFEWLRYASLPDLRIPGGMGKLLQAFADEIGPDEVMSYADLEWSDGGVYRTLGFKEAGFRKPVDFYVNPATWERISVKKISNDKKYRLSGIDTVSLQKITNLGSLKYLKLYRKQQL